MVQKSFILSPIFNSYFALLISVHTVLSYILQTKNFTLQLLLMAAFADRKAEILSFHLLMQIDVTDEQHSTNKNVRFNNFSPGFIDQNLVEFFGTCGNPCQMINFMSLKLGY